MTAKQQLKIDLDKLTYAPHPEVDKAYKEAGADHLHFKMNPSYVNEERLKICSTASGKPIRYKIPAIYRRVFPSGKEYVLFHLAASTFDYFGNIVEHFFSGCGRYEKPIISKTFGIPIGARMVSNTDVTKTMQAQELNVSIDHMEEVWEWEFEDYKEQLQEWKAQNIIDENTRTYLWVPPTKFTVAKWEDFLNLSAEDNILLNKAGTRFAGLLKGQTMTPEIMNALRDKLTEETIQEIRKPAEKK